MISQTSFGLTFIRGPKLLLGNISYRHHEQAGDIPNFLWGNILKGPKLLLVTISYSHQKQVRDIPNFLWGNTGKSKFVIQECLGNYCRPQIKVLITSCMRLHSTSFGNHQIGSSSPSKKFPNRSFPKVWGMESPNQIGNKHRWYYPKRLRNYLLVVETFCDFTKLAPRLSYPISGDWDSHDFAVLGSDLGLEQGDHPC